MKRILALATAGFSLLLLLLAPTISASAQVRPLDYSNWKTCTQNAATEECMWANGTVGNNVWGDPPENSNDDEQTTNAVATGICPGQKVTHTCPFTVGSGWNNEFFGSEIIDLSGTDTALCFLGQNSDFVVQGHCGATGTEWVVEGQGMGDAYFINVGESNFFLEPVYVCQDGTGNKLELRSFTNNTCLWFKGA
jgi:hypothetical protein